MIPYRTDIPPLLPKATGAEAAAILGAMRALAETGGGMTSADQRMLSGADHYIFGDDKPLDVGALKSVAPAALVDALASSGLAENALKFLTVMAFVDGTIDKAKIAAVLAYAAALGIEAHYLDQIREAAAGKFKDLLADMTRCNMESVLGKPWPGGDIDEWLQPYAGDTLDPALAKRFENLARLGPETFGHLFFTHFRDNGYAFPGEATALNYAFSVPHDSAHVISGFNTVPRGELLVSTFTSTMHPHFPMAGHVLPVIFSWHIGIAINDVARQVEGALDPDFFWLAWAAGAAMKYDTFAPDWNFWDHVEKPLAALRTEGGLPPEGLDPTHSPDEH